MGVMFKKRLGMHRTFSASYKSAAITGLIHSVSFIALNAIAYSLNLSDTFEFVLFIIFFVLFAISMQIWVFGSFKSSILGAKRLFVWFVIGGFILALIGVTSKLF